jgi:TRAP-type C4-dicarboxylate transport system permease large subunit
MAPKDLKAALFVAGVVPGIVMGTLIMAVCFVVNRGQAVGAGEKASLGTLVSTFFRALPSLLLIVIVLGGILGGVFSATEASAVLITNLCIGLCTPPVGTCLFVGLQRRQDDNRQRAAPTIADLRGDWSSPCS